MEIVNFDMLKSPANWVIVFLMLAIGVLGLRWLAGALGKVTL